MRHGALVESSQRLSRYGPLPALAVDLLLVMGCNDELHQLTIAQHIVHGEGPVPNPHMCAWILDVDALLAEKTSCFLVWLECPDGPPACVAGRGSRVNLAEDDLAHDASDAVCADEDVAFVFCTVGTTMV